MKLNGPIQLIGVTSIEGAAPGFPGVVPSCCVLMAGHAGLISHGSAPVQFFLICSLLKTSSIIAVSSSSIFTVSDAVMKRGAH